MTTTTITNDPRIESIQNLYAGYGSGDLDAALADLADDVDWAAEATGDAVPWYGNYRGKAEVPKFFAAIGSSVTVSEFDVVTITSNDDNVIAVVHWTYTVLATGRTASMYMQHWFRFDAGRIVFFRGSEDSGQSARAFA
jgi:ketosteroid isomerase-like protein